jgi:hypothetical protein
VEQKERIMKRLIGVSGKIGSGKDTVGGVLQLLFATHHPNGAWDIKKYAGKLKEVAEILTGIPKINFEIQQFKNTNLPEEWNKDGEAMSVRTLLQKIGTEALRDSLHENVWVNALFADYNDSSHWIITDVRFPNEAEAIKKHGGIILRIERDVPANDHLSETALDDYEFDHVINNNSSIHDLIVDVQKFAMKHKLI